MGDCLDDEVPIEWLADLLQLIHDTPGLDWLLLTKRPENWRRRIEHAAQVGSPELCGTLCGWLAGAPRPNVWLGTSVENQEYADKRIPELLKIPARVRFLSCEPLLGPVDLDLTSPLPIELQGGLNGGIHWVIVGGESGGKRREMKLEWAQSLHDQCKAAGVAFFMKQDSALKPGQRGRIPDDLWIQEFPVASSV